MQCRTCCNVMRCRQVPCVEPARTLLVALHWMQQSKGSWKLGMLVSASPTLVVRLPNPTKASLATCNPLASYRFAFSGAQQLLRSQAALHNGLQHA